MVPMPAPPRVWFLTDDESEVVQLQPDRFIRNWRRVKPDLQYPRYEPLRASFIGDFQEFSSFLASEGLTIPGPSLCEVSYTNHIAADVGNVFREHNEVAKVFKWGACTEGLPPITKTSA